MSANTMAVDGFFRKLREYTTDKSQWEIRPRSNTIRRKETLECPLCFVARMMVGGNWKNAEFRNAAAAIGLDREAARLIADAADGDTAWDVRKMRRYLERTLGLEG